MVHGGGRGEEGAGPGVTQGGGETEAGAGREHEKGWGGGGEAQAQASQAGHALRQAKQLELRLGEAETEAREQLGAQTSLGQTEHVIAGLVYRGGDR